MLLLMFAQSGDTPPVEQSGGAGFEMGAQIVYRKPYLQQVLEARAERFKPKGRRAKKRVQVIEVEAAQAVLAGEGEQKLKTLMRQWQAQAPEMPKAETVDVYQLFMAQVAFWVRKAQEEQQQDEEDALIALLT